MYTNTTEVNGQLFDDTTEVLLDLMAKSQNGRMRDMYDLALKAVEYYREYLDNNQPFDSTTSNFSSRLTNRATYVPYKKDMIVIPKNAVTSWEVCDCNGITHSKVEFLDHLATYEGI